MILETKKTLKTLSSGQIYKYQKKKKYIKKPLGWLKKKKNLVFFQPCLACMRSTERSLNVLPHTAQANGRSPVWTLWWVASSVLPANDLPHTWQAGR